MSAIILLSIKTIFVAGSLFLLSPLSYTNKNQQQRHLPLLKLNHCPADYIFMAHSLCFLASSVAIFQLLSFILSLHAYQSPILVRWPGQKATDLDLHCFLKIIYEYSAGKGWINNTGHIFTLDSICAICRSHSQRNVFN